MVDRRRKEEQRIKFFRFKHLLPLQNSVRWKVLATPSGDKDPAPLTSAFLPYKFSCFQDAVPYCQYLPHQNTGKDVKNQMPVQSSDTLNFPSTLKGDQSEAPPRLQGLCIKPSPSSCLLHVPQLCTSLLSLIIYLLLPKTIAPASWDYQI